MSRAGRWASWREDSGPSRCSTCFSHPVTSLHLFEFGFRKVSSANFCVLLVVPSMHVMYYIYIIITLYICGTRIVIIIVHYILCIAHLETVHPAIWIDSLFNPMICI